MRGVHLFTVLLVVTLLLAACGSTDDVYIAETADAGYTPVFRAGACPVEGSCSLGSRE
jgi:hypothetical protein